MYKHTLVAAVILCIAVGCSDDDPVAPSAATGTVTITGTLANPEATATILVRLRIEFDSIDWSIPSGSFHDLMTGPARVTSSGGSGFMSEVAETLDTSKVRLRYQRAEDGINTFLGQIVSSSGVRFALTWRAHYRGSLGGENASLDDILAADGTVVASGVFDEELVQYRGTGLSVSVRGTKALVEAFESGAEETE